MRAEYIEVDRRTGTPFLFPFTKDARLLVRRLVGTEKTNSRLRKEILRMRAASPGVVNYSNVGAWHSDPDDVAFNDTVQKSLHRFIEPWVSAYLTAEQQLAPCLKFLSGAWTVVYERGHYAAAHDHGARRLSGVYYVDEGDPVPGDVNSGVLRFLELQHSESFDVHPEAGLLVLFPSWLPHLVLAYQGERPRIAISFNLSYVL